MSLSPNDLALRLAAGLLSFPVTHFDARSEFDERAYRDHVAWMSGHDVAALFAAGGTGEFFSLSGSEVGRVVRAAVDTVNGRQPVLAPAGGSTATAVEQARDAEDAGADGILVFPPYLTEATPEGLLSRARAICASTMLGVVYYNRGTGVLGADMIERLAEECPNFIALKDGVGDIELMTKIFARLQERLVYIGGLPTAELFALPYLQLGLTTYSSAMFNFVPTLALEFYARVRAADTAAVFRILRDFVLPYTEIRDRHPATAVSIVKAGMRAVGRPAGPVRPPLVDLNERDQTDLNALVARVEGDR